MGNCESFIQKTFPYKNVQNKRHKDEEWSYEGCSDDDIKRVKELSNEMDKNIFLKEWKEKKYDRIEFDISYQWKNI